MSFASRSVAEHVLRGLAAAGLVVLAFWLLSRPGILPGSAAAAGLVGAAVLMRGCPTCWLVGLIETVAQRRHEEFRP